MKVDYIDIEEDQITAYLEDDLPIAVKKETLFTWLYDNDLLSWIERPHGPEDLNGLQSGTFSMEQYFELPENTIKIDVERFLNQKPIVAPSKVRSEKEIRDAMDAISANNELTSGYKSDVIEVLLWVLKEVDTFDGLNE